MKRFFLLCLLAAGLPLALPAQDLVTIPSEHLHTTDSVLVYKPADYQPDKTYPTLYVLHGFSDNHRTYGQKMDMQFFADNYQILLVCPNGFYNGWYMNATHARGMQWRTFFDRELYPLIEERYHTQPEQTFITGHSMGGQGSINVFIDNPDRFLAAGTMSGVMDLHHTPLREEYVSQVLGEYSASNPNFYTESAINRVELLKGTDKLLLISCGYGDQVYYHSSEAFARRCGELKLPHMILFGPGGHTWKYWDYAIREQIEIFLRILRKENLGY